VPAASRAAIPTTQPTATATNRSSGGSVPPMTRNRQYTVTTAHVVRPQRRPTYEPSTVAMAAAEATVAPSSTRLTSMPANWTGS
jgi:hypothetical protein